MTTSSKKALYFDGLAKVVGKYAYWFWPTLGMVFVAVSIALYSWTNEDRYLSTCIPLVIVVGIIPAVIGFAYAEFLELQEQAKGFIDAPPMEVQAWFSRQLKVFSDRKRMHVVSLVSFFAVAAAYEAANVFGAFQSLGHSFALFVSALAGLFTTVAIYHLFLLARLIWRLGRFDVLVEPYGCGLLSIGRFMFKYWVTAALLWALCLSSWITTPGVRLLSFLLAIPTSAFLIGSFVISMVPLHRQMIRFKQRKSSEIKVHLDELLAPGYKRLSADDRETVKFLEERATRVDALPEWPFKLSSLVGVSLSSLLTFLPSLLKILLNPVAT